jgi:hypothetical protein
MKLIRVKCKDSNLKTMSKELQTAWMELEKIYKEMPEKYSFPATKENTAHAGRIRAAKQKIVRLGGDLSNPPNF